MEEDLIVSHAGNHEKQKEIAKPFRRYQLLICLMVILSIILLSILASLNRTLSSCLKQYEDVANQYEAEKETEAILTIMEQKINVSYSALYGIDKELNTDIIRSMDEFFFITNMIDPNSTIEFMVCYKASEEGDDPAKFREGCGGMGPILLLVETVEGYRFGGYTVMDFMDDINDYKEDDEAFLFSFDSKKKYKVQKPGEAVGDFDGEFPRFGNGDIKLSKGCLSNKESYTEFPQSYEEDINAPSSYMLNGGIKNFRVKEIEAIVIFDNFMW